MILTVTANAAIDKRYVVTSFGVDKVNRVKECAFSAGGKGLNVSRAATIAGEQVIATGFTGGFAGGYIEAGVEAMGVKNAFVRCKGESRSCINIWDETNHTQTEFLEPGFNIDESDMDRLLDRFKELIPQVDIVTISGSMPAGGTPRLYREMLRIAREHGKKVILDASGKTLENCLDYGPYMIKPNMDEIRLLTGREIASDEELLEAAETLHRCGIGVVVISRGGDGCIVSCEDGVYEARVPKIEAVNTVGCGDAMLAGFAAGFTRGLDMPGCIRLASAVSAASAMRMETGYLLREDMEKLLPEITITKVR